MCLEEERDNKCFLHKEFVGQLINLRVQGPCFIQIFELENENLASLPENK